MRLIVKDKEVSIDRQDIDFIIDAYKTIYEDSYSKTTVEKLTAIDDNSIIRIDSNKKKIDIDKNQLSYTHTYIYAMFLRQYSIKAGIHRPNKYSEKGLITLCEEQLTNIVKQCEALARDSQEVSKASLMKVKSKFIDLYNNICKAFNRLQILCGSYASCNNRILKQLCDCADSISRLRSILGQRIFRTKQTGNVQ